MNARRSEGKAALGLAALLAVLVAAGGVNYVRNLRVDQASEARRPFHSYEGDDLTALRSAYEAEIASLQRRYDAARAGRKRSGSHAMMDEAVADFERVRAQSDGLRELGTLIAEREARIRDIDAELSARSEIGEGWDAHLRRLTRI
jgi:hypothetical protein